MTIKPRLLITTQLNEAFRTENPSKVGALSKPLRWNLRLSMMRSLTYTPALIICYFGKSIDSFGANATENDNLILMSQKLVIY